MNFIDYEPRYKDAIFELEAKQWGAGSDSDDIMQNLEKYNIKLIENNGGGFVDVPFGMYKMLKFVLLTWSCLPQKFSIKDMAVS